MKRLYASAEVHENAEGFGIGLDGQPVLTPARVPLVVPAPALARAIAKEWAGQGERVIPASMPLTRLAATAIDHVAHALEAVIASTAKYAGADLLCYRADAPAELSRRQAAIWQPLLDWASLEFDAPLYATIGVTAVAQPPASLLALARSLPQDPFALSGLADLTQLSGSLIVALAVWRRRLDAAGAAEVALLDETFQAERWGEDAEAAIRRAHIRAEIEAAAQFLACLAA